MNEREKISTRKQQKKLWISSSSSSYKLQIQTGKKERERKKSGEHRVNIVNVTLNHRHKKAKKHKEKKVPGQQINLRVKKHTVMERIACIKYGECLDSITQHHCIYTILWAADADASWCVAVDIAACDDDASECIRNKWRCFGFNMNEHTQQQQQQH